MAIELIIVIVAFLGIIFYVLFETQVNIPKLQDLADEMTLDTALMKEKAITESNRIFKSTDLEIHLPEESVTSDLTPVKDGIDDYAIEYAVLQGEKELEPVINAREIVIKPTGVYEV